MDLEAALGYLSQQELIRQTAELDLAFTFKHVLIQETVYTPLLRQDRRALHRLIAERCQEVFGSQLDENLLLFAYHFGQAGENSRAIEFLTQYAEQASRMGAYPEAMEAYERAVALAAD